VKNLKILVIFLSFFLMNCCVRSRISPYPGINYMPTDPQSVRIYHMPPPLSFEIIGEVEASGAPAASWGRVENYMKKKAASIGGDAIVIIEKREPYVGTYTTASRANAFIYGNYIYYTYQPGTSYAMHRKNLIGLVIRWKKEK
jgi:hypothetical protein